MKAAIRVQNPIGLPTIGAGHHLCCQASLSHGLNLVGAYSGLLAHHGQTGVYLPEFSTATKTLDLPAAPRPRLPGLGPPT